ncbi:hypothetical protein PybrP1_005241 [[Pythium] brassicae (nom. inval.)]|nr:hypothetical protein PybrP1_005241 [[Pythium] brassicae (nom. inval.)]
MKIAELLSATDGDGYRVDATQQQPCVSPMVPRVQDLSMSRIMQELRQAGKAAHEAAAEPSARETPDAQDADTNADAEAAGTRRRRTRNGFTPLTESEKRVKQRQLVKRSYYRKIDTINELREVSEKLEHEFRRVLTGRRRLSAQRPLDVSPFEELREQYAALALTKDDLRQENEALRSVAAEQSKARTRVGILVDEELRDQADAARAVGLPSPRPNAEPQAPPPSTSAAELDLVPISQSECLAVVREAYARIMAFRAAQNLVSTGASVFGWRDRRKVEGDTMKFFLEKTFPRSAESVATALWDVLSTEAGANRVYSSSVAIRFRLVQRVDANNVVFYRTIEREGQGVVIKSLVLAALVQIETGYMLLFRSLDPAQRLRRAPESPSTRASPFAAQVRELWADVFSWGHFEVAGEHQELCRNSFGGFVPSSTATSLEFWLMHILLIAVRCETEAIGSVFLLQRE